MKELTVSRTAVPKTIFFINVVNIPSTFLTPFGDSARPS